MSNIDMPESVNRFKSSTNEITLLLEDMCCIGLGMPLERLSYWDIPPDYDAYRIHTTNGLQFVVSGPQVAHFSALQEEFRNRHYEG